ncbi:MAG TPA: CDP-diacylglycerol--glycerol-3-phosphate 3-phosphatidyltransferase [Candidatus Cloacimonadota bacterium]|nr:CDP-diacylglycerol--glycerol-3-phosphate 3-phosphatidyltransferase [Candidatus Cloacimonadota bacterium]
MKKYIPNSLTILRLILVPIFVWLTFLSSYRLHFLMGTIVFILASITDYYDGMLARKMKVVTNFGKIMDPIADKILVFAALIALALPEINLITIPVIVIITLREIIITIVRTYYMLQGFVIPAERMGKWKTALQMTGIIAALLYKTIFLSLLANYQFYFEIIFQSYFWIVAIITVVSGFSLVRNIGKKKRGQL